MDSWNYDYVGVTKSVRGWIAQSLIKRSAPANACGLAQDSLRVVRILLDHGLQKGAIVAKWIEKHFGREDQPRNKGSSRSFCLPV